MTSEAFVSVKYLERLIDLQNDLENNKLNKVPENVLTQVSLTLNLDPLYKMMREMGQINTKGINKISMENYLEKQHQSKQSQETLRSGKANQSASASKKLKKMYQFID